MIGHKLPELTGVNEMRCDMGESRLMSRVLRAEGRPAVAGNTERRTSLLNPASVDEALADDSTMEPIARRMRQDRGATNEASDSTETLRMLSDQLSVLKSQQEQIQRILARAESAS